MDTKSRGKKLSSFFLKHIILSMIILIGLFISADYFEQMSRYTKYRGPITQETQNAKRLLESFTGDMFTVNYEIYRNTVYLKEYKDIKNKKLMVNNTIQPTHIKYAIFNYKDKALFTNSSEVYEKYNLGEEISHLDKYIENDADTKYLGRLNASASPSNDIDEYGNTYVKDPEKYELRFWIPKYEFVNDGKFAIIENEKLKCESKQKTYYSLYIVSLVLMGFIVLMIIIAPKDDIRWKLNKIYNSKFIYSIRSWFKEVYHQIYRKRSITLKVIIASLPAFLMVSNIIYRECYGYFQYSGVLITTTMIIILLLIYLINLSIDIGKLENYTSDTSITKLDDKIRNYNLKVLSKDIESLKLGYNDAVNERIKNERLKAELVTNISHDLKTPLTSIINYTDILLNKDITDSEREDYIRVLNNKGHKLKNLIDDLFEISKITSGKAQINFASVNIVELINQTLGELSSNIESSGIEFIVNSDSNDIELNLDGNKVSRVFENLVTNIIKYSLNGTRAYIDVVEEKEQVRIYFKNISKEKIELSQGEFFERFSRGDKARNSSIEGNGLGLSIAKSIVDAHDGNIDISVDGDLFKVIVTFSK